MTGADAGALLANGPMHVASGQEWLILFGGARRQQSILRLASSGRKIRAVIVPRTRSPELARSIDEISRLGLTVIETAKGDVDAALLPFAGLPVLSVGFPYFLSPQVLTRHQVRVNIHPALLPAYRGPTAGYYVVANNERESGSTVHRIDPGMDDGPIVAQRRFPIGRFDTARSVQRKAYAIEPDLLIEAIEKLERGVDPQPQDESKASYYPKKRTPADSEIDPSKSILELYDSIRACDPNAYPAFFFVDGQKVCVRLWRPDRPSDDQEDMV